MKLRIGVFTRSNEFIRVVNSIDAVTNADCSIYQDFNDFISKSKGDCDIILIDFDTQKNVNIEMASLEYFCDTTIVFVTSQELVNYKQMGNLNNLIRFVYIKQLPLEIMKIVQEVTTHRKPISINVRENKDLYKLYFSEIYGVYPDGHYLNFLTLYRDEAIRVRMWMREIDTLLFDNNFIKCKGSLFINIHLIKSIDYNNRTINFVNGKHEKFSKRNYKEIAEKFLEEV